MGKVIAGAWFALLFLAAFRKGRTQWIESGATMARRFWITGLLTAIASAPILIAAVSGTRDLGLGETAVVLEEVHAEDGSVSYVERPIEVPIRPDTLQPTLLVVIVAALLSTLILLVTLRPMGSFLDKTGGAALGPAHPLHERVLELAREMGVRPPRVVVSHSAPGVMQMMAAAGGLFGPMLIATDGLLHRMPKPDRDAIMAHELGHFRSGGIWPTFLVVLGFPILPVLASTRLDSITSIVLGFSAVAWVLCLRGWFNETGADLAGAKAVGFAAMARALDKIHAPLQHPEHGLLAYLSHATAIHPPREVRLASLRRAAPSEEKCEIQVDRARVRRHRLAHVLALVVWAALLTSACWLARDGRLAIESLALLLTPLVFQRCVSLTIRRKALGLARQLSPNPFSLATFALLLLTWIAAVAGLYLWLDLPGVLAGLGVMILTALARVVGKSRSDRLARTIERPLRQREFGNAIEAYRRLGKRQARLPVNRVNHAFALAASGDREAAIGELVSLVRDKPRLQVASVWLARFVRYKEPERSLEILVTLAKPLQKSWLVHCMRAQALRLLGRGEAAWAAAGEAIRAGPKEGTSHTAAAFVAAELGLLKDASERIADAERLEPGDTGVVLARAAVAIASGDARSAREALDRAREAVKNDPLAFLEEELTIQERRAAAMPIVSATPPR